MADTKPLFKRIGGEWVKQTAFERIGGAWTKISDATPVVEGSYVSLEVEKITSNTYDGTTTYQNEQFVLFDIYPFEVGDVVNVTYGDLTKTLTFDGVNAQQVFFGTFLGVTDDVATPDSGTLIIEGGFKSFGQGRYKQQGLKGSGTVAKTVTAVNVMRGITEIPNNAFSDGLASYMLSPANIEIPNTVVSIGDSALFLVQPAVQLTLTFEANSQLTTIGRQAIGAKFQQQVVLPPRVSFIGHQGIFLMSNNVETVRLLGTTPPTLGYDEINDSETGVVTRKYDNFGPAGDIIVPRGSLNAYKTAPDWIESGYADKVVEATE